MKFKLICVDGTYTGILNGNIFVSESLTTEQVTKLVSNPTEEEIIEIFNPKLNEIVFSNNSETKLGIPPNKADKVITNPNLFKSVTTSSSKIIRN